MTNDVRNNPAKGRFELAVEGHIAAAYYDISGNVITFTHTEVPKELEGRGIASRLIKGTLDQVRAQRLKIVPLCPFVKAYVSKHSEYADLLN